MRKSLLLLALCCFSAIYTFSQASSATAVTVTPVAYTGAAPVTATYSLVLGSAQTFNTCVGSQSVYWFKFNIPVPGSSLNGTRSVKITANSAAFSPIIDFYDNALAFKECVSGNIMRTTPTTNPIIPGQDFYFRVSSTALSTGSSFTLAVEYYPVAEVRFGFYPSVDADGYGLCDQIKRNNITGLGVITNSRFRIVPTSTPNNGSCSATVAGANTIALTNQFSCACFGTTYDCYVEVQIDGHWCGESLPQNIIFQNSPTVSIIPPSTPTVPLNGFITSTFACGSSEYEWRFVGQGGNTITCSAGINSSIGLDNCDCLRYNRIYQVMVRVRSTCNATLWSPWSGPGGANSAPYILYTPPMPTITIPAVHCNAVISQYTYFDVDYIANVSSYRFQSTRVSPTSPYAPIAPPVLVLNNSNSGYTIIGNVPGATYRTCFKPYIGSCNSPQEGSWGPYCYYAIAPGTAPNAMPLENNEEIAAFNTADELTLAEPQENAVSIFKNGSETMVMVDLKDQTITGTAMVRLYNINGQLVYADNFPYATGTSVFQLSMPNEMSDGTYIMKIACDTFSVTEKVVLTALN